MMPFKVIFPLALFVKPAPSLIVILVSPTPESIATPVAILITALPGSLLASTTPLELVSLAVKVKLPLSVTISLFTIILLPACKVIAPPSPDGLLVIIGSFTVMSLFACNTTLVPVLVLSVILLAGIVLGWSGVSLKLTEVSFIGGVPIVISLGSSNKVPGLPRFAPALTIPLKSSDSLPETSTNPPFPPSFPPRAKISPKN